MSTIELGFNFKGNFFLKINGAQILVGNTFEENTSFNLIDKLKIKLIYHLDDI